MGIRASARPPDEPVADPGQQAGEAVPQGKMEAAGVMDATQLGSCQARGKRKLSLAGMKAVCWGRRGLCSGGLKPQGRRLIKC